MELGLREKVAVVVGGTSGIGAATVEALFLEGCRVRFCGRNPVKISKLLAKLSPKLTARCGNVKGDAVDIDQASQSRAWLASIEKIDILVLCASAMSPDLEVSVRTDLLGVVGVIEMAMAKMAEGGSITLIGSSITSHGSPSLKPYGAAKAFIAHYMKSCSVECAARGVRVNVVSPGEVFESGGYWDRVRTQSPEYFDRVLAHSPMGRMAEPREIAQIVTFLASPAASFVSGANWYADGGVSTGVQY